MKCASFLLYIPLKNNTHHEQAIRTSWTRLHGDNDVLREEHSASVQDRGSISKIHKYIVNVP